METTYTASQFNDSRLINFNDIVFAGMRNGKILTKTIYSNIYTFFDNQSNSSSLVFDNTSYSTPSNHYLRGGISKLVCDSILNPSQTNERNFYKWSDGYMYPTHIPGYSNGHDFYFDMSGTTIANYYKTKQLSTVPSAISNQAQTKSVRDVTVNNVTATHTIHESMGGIFYSKSTNFGLTYQTEETVNLSEIPGAADGNKNGSVSIIGNGGSSVPITASDQNRNVAVVWEKYNSATGKVEIKLARRILNTAQNGYEWKTYSDNNGNQYVTAFTASSSFESKPNCFITSNPGELQNWNSSLVIITYIRPEGSQNKLFTSVRYNTQSQDYELDNGNIQELSVTSPSNYYSSYNVHFTYLKDANVAYRREEFGYYNGNIYGGTSPPPEVNSNISSGDGYASRYKPDISLMNGVPVVSYAANYDAKVWVSYEGGETDIIPIHRYPIIKVQRSNTGSWGSYIIYNSTGIQDNPDIEGSGSTESYLINYSLGNGQFKKVVKVYGQPGYFCEPNTFTGTDSKLIKNSYTGLFGSNLSLLTLSPNAGLYRLDK